MRSLLVALAALTLGCAPARGPCASPACGAGYECLANRCVPSGGEPVPPGSRRVSLEPSAVGVASGTGPSAATLGGATSSALYLRFDPSWKSEGAVSAAFLLLETMDGTSPSPRDVPLEVWLVGSPWSAERTRRGSRPALRGPRSTGYARTSPRAIVRIDVTRLARELARRRDDEGLAVTAPASDGPGVVLSTGTAGPPPRFELYLAEDRSGGAW